MRSHRPTLLSLAAAAAFFASAAFAGDVEIKIPLPPLPKFVIPKPPVPKVKVQTPETVRRNDDRASRRYDYYPEHQVYFDPARRLYFFLEANRWVARAMLPPGINVRVGAPVVVDLHSDNPYEHHEDVTRMYPGHREDHRRYGYQEGFDDGYGEGYNDGYNAGFKSSFDQGYRDGYRAALQDRDRGRDEDRRDRGRRGWDKKGRD